MRKSSHYSTRKRNINHTEEFFWEIETSCTFERSPGSSEVNLDRRHRGHGGLMGPTGHLNTITTSEAGDIILPGTARMAFTEEAS